MLVSFIEILIDYVVDWGGAVAHGYYALFQIKWSRLEPWMGTLCFVLGQDP